MREAVSRCTAVTVDAVEAATGLNFFSLLPKEQQEQQESTITIQAWPWQGGSNEVRSFLQ